MTKDGKLFGKISIIDLLVIVAIIVAALGVYSRLFNNETRVETSTSVIEYDMLVKGVRQGTVDALGKGGPMYDASTKEYMGEIIGMEYKEATEPKEKEDGTIVNATLPDKYDVTFTVRIDGSVNDSGYYTATNQMLCAGSRYVVNAKYAKTTAKIIDVREVAD